MSLTATEQAQMRSLALVLPILTLCTHTMLALSSAWNRPDHNRPPYMLAYNSLAASASILGFLGAVKLIPSLISIYTFIHAATLSFATTALLHTPIDFRFANPVMPSWHIDGDDICRDFEAGVGWDDECCKRFGLVRLLVSGLGLILMAAQWWALMTVRRWGKELQSPQVHSGADVEKAGISYLDDDAIGDGRTTE